MSMVLFVLALSCSGKQVDSLPNETGDDGSCPYEEIAPVQDCRESNRSKWVCATCDPATCSNCPTSWTCGTFADEVRWGGDSVECECIGEDGNLLQDDGCGDSGR